MIWQAESQSTPAVGFRWASPRCGNFSLQRSKTVLSHCEFLVWTCGLFDMTPKCLKADTEDCVVVRSLHAAGQVCTICKLQILNINTKTSINIRLIFLVYKLRILQRITQNIIIHKFKENCITPLESMWEFRPSGVQKTSPSLLNYPFLCLFGWQLLSSLTLNCCINTNKKISISNKMTEIS